MLGWVEQAETALETDVIIARAGNRRDNITPSRLRHEGLVTMLNPSYTVGLR